MRSRSRPFARQPDLFRQPAVRPCRVSLLGDLLAADRNAPRQPCVGGDPRGGACDLHRPVDDPQRGRARDPLVLRSNAGLELALANYDGALAPRPDDSPKFADRIVAIPLPRRRRAARDGRAGGEVAYFRGLGEQTRAWITAHPRDFLRLCAEHVRELYFPEEWAYTYNESDAFNAPRSLIIALVNALGLASLLAGLVTRRRGCWMIGVYVVGLTLTLRHRPAITRYTYLLTLPLLFVAADGLVRAARAAQGVLSNALSAARRAPVRQIGKPPDLAPAARHRIEDQPGKETQHGDDRHPGNQDRGRKARDQPGVEIGQHQRHREQQGGDKDQRADRAVEQHRTLDPVQRADRLEDAPAVAVGRQLRRRAFGRAP